MKTIERLDFPLRVYFKDGECHHDSAVIVFTHDAPAYVRASSPFAIYPWENIKHIIRVADEAQGDGLMGKHKVLREENIRLHKLHTDKRLALHKALGLLDSEDLDHAALCERVASLVNNNRAATTTANINAEEVKTLRADLASMAEQRDLLKRQIEELRAETRKPALSQAKQVEPGGPIWVRVVDTSSKRFGLVGRLVAIEEEAESEEQRWHVELENGLSVLGAPARFAVVGAGRQGHGPTDTPQPDTEQRDVLKRQLDELRRDLANSTEWRTACAELEAGVARVMQAAGLGAQVRGGDHGRLPIGWVDALVDRVQPSRPEPGGPIWVRVVDTSSKHFGLVGRLEGIEFDSKHGDEMWSVDMGGIANVRWRANVFAVVGTGRQGPGPNEAPKPDSEHQQAQNRDQWRATCLANGAKDCTVYFGPGTEVTFVVELKPGATTDYIAIALRENHGLTQFGLREVRPIADGVKPRTFKHPADNGQP